MCHPTVNVLLTPLVPCHKDGGDLFGVPNAGHARGVASEIPAYATANEA